MNFNGLIMSGNEEVTEIKNNIVEPIKTDKMPLYFINGGSFTEWLKSRAIDRHRPNSRILKKMLRLSDTSDLSTVLYAHAATITDNFWIKSNEESLTFEDVIFKKNYFSEIALLGSAKSFNRNLTQAELLSTTPELTNIGSFEKCWKWEDGSWVMYKQGNVLERFSEIFIAKLSAHFGFPCAEYGSVNEFIKTKDFTEGKYNYEPIASLVGDNEDYIYNYDKLYNLQETLAEQYLNILFMDTLCFNMDRHTYNYGLLRDKQTGKILSMAPNFDNNIALISRGYSSDAKASANLLIELFGELLEERDIKYEIPKVTYEEINQLIEESLPEEMIDRKYVADFIMDRYQRIESIVLK